MDKYDATIQDLAFNLFSLIRVADEDDAEVLFHIDKDSVHTIAMALKEKKLI